MASEGISWFFEAIDHITAPAKSMSKATGGLEDQLRAVDREIKKLDRDAKHLKLGKALGMDITKEQAAHTAAQLRAMSAQRIRAGMARADIRGAMPSRAPRAERGGAGGGFGGMAAAGMAIAGIAAAVTAAAGLASAFHETVSYAIQLNSQVESTRIALAGMMQAGGLTQSLDLAKADAVMSQIRRDAAKLPGEAEEFVDVFRTALPQAISAGMRNTAEIARFTNQVAAVGITLGEDAPQIGRDLNLLLAGRAGAANALWTRLGENIKKAGKALGVTVTSAQQFNRLRPEQRLRLIQDSLHGYDDAISAFSDTWEAVESTTSSALKEFMRFGGGAIFDGIKSALKGVNDWMERNEFLLNVMSGLVGNLFLNAWRMVSRSINGIRTRDLIVGFTTVYNVVHAMAAAFSNQVWPIIKGLAGGFLEGFIGGLQIIVPMLKAMAGTKVDSEGWRTFGRILGGIAVAIVSVVAVLGSLVTMIAKSIGNLFSTFSNIGTNIVAGMRGGISRAWPALLTELASLVTGIPNTVQMGLDMHSPSRVMAGLGQLTAQGFEEGILSGAGRVNAAMSSLARPPQTRPTAGGNRGDVNIEVHIEGAGGSPQEVAERTVAELVSLFERLALQGGT